MSAGQIIALGGDGCSLGAGRIIEDYILAQAMRARPRICFIPTASGDNESYIVQFYRRFSDADCVPTHLELFKRTVKDLAAFVQQQDIVYVGGGNAANLLAVWRLHGLDEVLRNAYQGGMLLAGVSAGSLCWFEQGVTDSFGNPELAAVKGLGLLPGSHCPHFDTEPTRRPAYRRLISAGMPGGIAADDGVALHFAEGSLKRVISSRAAAKAYRVRQQEGVIIESVIEPDVAGSEPSR